MTIHMTTPAVQGTMAAIADEKRLPVHSKPAHQIPADDKLKGHMFAQEAIALCMSQQSGWTNLARQLFEMNMEQRQAGLSAWATWKKQQTQANKEAGTPYDDKAFKAMLNTATVRLSHLRKIATAIDGGMDDVKLVQLTGRSFVAHTVDTLYQAAKGFSGTSKQGRPEKTFAEKLAKLLSEAAEGMEPDEQDLYFAVKKDMAQFKPELV